MDERGDEVRSWEGAGTGGHARRAGARRGRNDRRLLSDLLTRFGGDFRQSERKLVHGVHAHVDGALVLLVDGRVLVSSSNDPTLEIYDPATDSFTLVTPIAPHPQGFMVRLRDGRVLLGGGEGSSAAAEVFDSDQGTFAATGSLQTGRFWPTAHTLPDGRVVVLGGSLDTPWTYVPLDSIEVYDPSLGVFAVAPYKLASPRYGQASALVRDGTIIAIGGYTTQDTTPGSCLPTATVDQIDPIKMTVTSFATLPHVAADLSAVTLLDGSIVAVGGGGCGPLPNPDVDFLPGKPASQ